MTSTAALKASTTFLAQLANPAARALALSVIVGLGLAAFRVKTTSLRLFTWTALLYTALAMPVLQWMLPPLPIPAPAFLQNAFLEDRTAQPERMKVKVSLAASAAGEVLSAPKKALPLTWSAPPASRTTPPRGEASLVVSPTASSSFLPSIRWSVVAAATYLGVAGLLLARFFVGLAFARRLLQAAHRIDEPRLTLRLVSRAYSSGLARIPHAVESEFISVPVTMGVLQSTILLPASWREWDDAKLDAVVAHEVSHVARRDPLTQRLSLLHRALFWFSPLSWWLDRCLADLAEQASDEAALSCGTDRKHYARILLGFFEALHAAPGRVWWQGVSMGKGGQAEQRVERILAWKGSVAMRLKKSIAVVVVALQVPVVYLAASAHPAHPVGLGSAQLAQDQTPPTARPALAPKSEATAPSEPAPAPGVIGGTIAGAVSGVPAAPPAPTAPAAGVATTVIAPVPPSAPVAPLPPPAVWSGRGSENSRGSWGGFSYAYGFDDEQRFVIVSGKTDSLTMSGSSEDARHVEKLRKSVPGDFIWFQRDEKSYIIRDQATVDRARKLWAPQEELGKKQEALGKQQEVLGNEQQELGARMEQIHVNVPDMTEDLDKLKAELKQLSSGATSEQVGHIQSEIGELQSKIGELQSHAGHQQGELGEEMGALGEKQGKLGAQQGELGRQQAELAREATRQMKQLLDQAIAKGIAQLEI
jgi:beta-lactamase regulating signal transducer with metallopeptidase domain